MQTRKCHTHADTDADANRIRTKNNMPPSPLVGDIMKVEIPVANYTEGFQLLNYFYIYSILLFTATLNS